MKQSIWFFFFLHAVTNALGLAVTFGVIGVVAPLLVMLFTHQLNWMEFNEWLGYVLVGGVIGIMMAGIFTAYEWYRRSVLPVMRKGIITALIYTLIIVGAWITTKEIRVLFPIPEKPEKPASMAKPVPDGWKYVPVEVLPPPQSKE